jgi:hypothetical protein
VFVSPQEPQSLVLFHRSANPAGKGFPVAYPFLIAAVAEKAERKTPCAGMVNRLIGQRNTFHGDKIKVRRCSEYL